MNKHKFYSYTQDYKNRWVVSYADFITVLLAVFIVMYAVSQLNIEKMNLFSNSIEHNFNSTNKPSNTIVKNKESLAYKRSLLKIFNKTKVNVASSSVDLTNQQTQINELKKHLTAFSSDIDKESIEFANLKKNIENKFGKVDDLYLKRESRGLIIRFKDNVLFDTGSDIIKDKAKKPLDKLALVLKDMPNSIRIEGHTDDTPIKTSKFPSNWELSTARATNIVKYLIKNHNYSPANLSAVGYGEYKPLKIGTTKETRAINRRVDIVILSNSSQIFEPVEIKE